ncbi:HAD family hydrolase [Streptomyces sp. NPDC005963]|uniref:HAD family hydrolase n=1 Tax=Streptomyces sp. NPDC005963 TaxID=3156721 RepID=UPI003403C590
MGLVSTSICTGPVFEAELTAVEGNADVLHRLATAFCVVSNGDHSGIRRSLETVDLIDHSEDRISSAADVTRGKPAPDLFLHAARAMGVDSWTVCVHREQCLRRAGGGVRLRKSSGGRRPRLAGAAVRAAGCLAYAFMRWPVRRHQRPWRPGR